MEIINFHGNFGDALTVAVQAMPPEKCIQIVSKKNETGLLAGPLDHEIKKLKSPEKFNVIIQMERIGAIDFMSDLEYTHFNIHTMPQEIADQFEVRIIKWQDMVWWVISIPFKKRKLAYQTAEKYQMRLDEGAIPIVIANGPQLFPLSENASTLVYQSNHPDYDNDLKERDNLRKQEDARVQRRLAKYGDMP